jgi:curved DNA-binding protein CbpA
MADRFLLLCCRSCLKGDDNTEYYEVLGLENRHVDTDTIKKAYKKASLNLHPDKLAQKGIEQTHEHKQQFLKVRDWV